jgi:hypothetical protein
MAGTLSSLLGSKAELPLVSLRESEELRCNEA